MPLAWFCLLICYILDHTFFTLYIVTAYFEICIHNTACIRNWEKFDGHTSVGKRNCKNSNQDINLNRYHIASVCYSYFRLFQMLLTIFYNSLLALSTKAAAITTATTTTMNKNRCKEDINHLLLP